MSGIQGTHDLEAELIFFFFKSLSMYLLGLNYGNTSLWLLRCVFHSVDCMIVGSSKQLETTTRGKLSKYGPSVDRNSVQLVRRTM